MVRRYLAWRGYEVTYVSNVTNIEDKIIARAAREGTNERELADHWESVYWEALDRLGVDKPDEIPRATEFIDHMIALIAELVASGHAYVIEGEGVYFAVDAYAGYGELSHRRVEDLLGSAGARVDVDARKRSAVDFALWKAAKPGEPDWDSPWGRGRPGWHIECSAMSLELLGESFDLHGGGNDLVFPHHENERAQAEAAGHPFARHWIHSGMVMIDGEKMSKSLHNFTLLTDALDEFGARAFRLAVLQVHYRSPMELGESELRDAAEAIARLESLLRRASAEQIVPADGADESKLEPTAIAAFRTSMDNDFGSPGAVAAVFETVRRANLAIDDGRHDEAALLVGTVVHLTSALGLEIGTAESSDSDDDADVDALVEARTSARKAGDFAEADRIREELAGQGIALEDTAGGTIWHRSA
jgi:cysteinyl-tRNA synthetase